MFGDIAIGLRGQRSRSSVSVACSFLIAVKLATSSKSTNMHGNKPFAVRALTLPAGKYTLHCRKKEEKARNRVLLSAASPKINRIGFTGLSLSPTNVK